MKLALSVVSRLTALVILLIFTFVSCYNPANFGPPPRVVITPGEGTPTYVFVDADLNIVEEDEGRTALFIEDNPNARGVIVIADTYLSYKRVIIYNSNNDSTVAMYFASGARFPYFMSARHGEDEFHAYFSYFRDSSSTFDVFLSDDDFFWPITNLVLNRNIFDLYQMEPGYLDRDESQNLRIRNIIVALGLSASLSYHAFPGVPGDDFVWAEPAFLSGLARGVAGVFRGAAFVATIVAVVVAPIVSLVHPQLGLAVAAIMTEIAAVSIALAEALESFANWMDGTTIRPPPPIVAIPAVAVTVVNKDSSSRDLINGEEFHLAAGQEVLLQFSSPGMDHNEVTLAGLMGGNLGWEPGNPNFPRVTNSLLFSITLETYSLPPDAFRIRIRLSPHPDSIGDGRVAFGFLLAHQNLQINGSVQPVEFMFLTERKPSMRTDTVAVWFCIHPNCEEDRGES
jgi:hypothetical protein